jgi:quercetin dioxygenase-like cupin family protein
MLVKFPPDAASPPHRHGGASVVAYVVEGTSRNKMNDEPLKIMNKGDTWYEAPGCHHKVSSNASKTEPMMLLATFVVDKKVVEEGGHAALVQVDEEFKDITVPVSVP